MRTAVICVLALVVLSESLPIRSVEDETIKVAALEMQSVDEIVNKTELSRAVVRNSIRPGVVVTRYILSLSPNVNGGSFNGIAEIDVNIIDLDTREDEIVFHVEELNIQSVAYRIGGGSITYVGDFDIEDDLLNIDTGRIASQYTFVIEYTGSLNVPGVGLWAGNYQTGTYVGMNLYPTNARRVFPCIDEPTEAATMSFTFNNLDYQNVVFNSMLEDGSQTQFRALPGPPHVFGLVAHNFQSIFFPITGVQVFGRTGFSSQDAQATAISFLFTTLNTWTNKDYLDIDVNQEGRMVILALPDVSVEWNALSTVGIWEPYVIMEHVHATKQRATGLVEVAEAMARQWFGYVVYPENWRHQWFVSGMGSYTAWEILKQFQTPNPNDISLLDINTLFVTEVIQEGLLRDASVISSVLEPDDDIFELEDIRDHLNNLKYKSTALMRMLRLMLGNDDVDYVQIACQSMLNTRTLQTVNSINFYDAINSEFGGNDFIEDIEEYMEQWIKNTGYPILSVATRSGGVILTQERFSFTPLPQVSFEIPITYTTRGNPNFDNVYPQLMAEGTELVDVFLDMEHDCECDWIVFNVQGQGYYRVNYAEELWLNLIEALNDPAEREVIHPLNRATLVDDALNLARADKMTYELALSVVLAMEHETEYAPWKAFIRNMEFLRKRLVPYAIEEELDDVYVRMVSRSIVTLENEIGFFPDPLVSEPSMVSLTRGIVMDHACRANYQPCIAAAVDWFYAPGTDEPTVNPNIPNDMRPAVYCTMVREGGDEVIRALENRLLIESTQYERVVILESFGCSADANFISTLLETTIAGNSGYVAEEKFRILAAVIGGSYDNTLLALDFMSRRTNEIRTMYGGPKKLEDLIFILADNIADDFLTMEFNNWRSDRNNNLDSSEDAADRAYDIIIENQAWNRQHLEDLFEWIDENDAPTLAVSVLLLCLTTFFALFNH